MTTVGYGDVYPITGFGKFIRLIAVLRMGLVALPTGLISAGFIEKIGKTDRRSKRCPHCGKVIDSKHQQPIEEMADEQLGPAEFLPQ